MVEQAQPELPNDATAVLKYLASDFPTTQNVDKFYNGMTADGYDDWAKATNFAEPIEFCKLVGPGMPVDIPSTSEVLDAGAGTGICGILLKEKGFTNIVGVDASSNLLDRMNATGAYKESRCFKMGLGLD